MRVAASRRPSSPVRGWLLVALVGLLAAGCGVEANDSALEQEGPPSTFDFSTTTTEPEPETTTTEPDETTTTEDEEPPEPTRVPAIGDCWEATDADQLSEVSFTGERVDCAEPHGGVTIEVRNLREGAETLSPEILDADPLDDADAYAAIQDAGTEGCTDAWDTATKRLRFTAGVSGATETTRVTKLERTFWLPTGDDWEAGARWIRCDLQTVDGSTFQTDDLTAIGARGVPADLVLCLSDDGEYGEPISCDSDGELWQGIATFQVPAEVLPTDQAAYDRLLGTTLAAVCGQVTAKAVGPVGQRAFRAFGETDVELADGSFLCAAGVQGPVTEPLGS